jgi:hypothetical protein
MKKERRGGLLCAHQIGYKKVDGSESEEKFYSSSPNAEEALCEFLNSRLVVEAWVIGVPMR